MSVNSVPCGREDSELENLSNKEKISKITFSSTGLCSNIFVKLPDRAVLCTNDNVHSDITSIVNPVKKKQISATRSKSNTVKPVMKHIVKKKHSANRSKSIIVNPVMQNMVKHNNIQIVGLNVNGLVSKVEHGVLEVYLNNFDIACLTETKIDHIEDDFLPNFHSFILGRKNKSHRYGGIHGICIMVKKNLVDFVSVVRETSDENVLWIKIDKGAFGLECILDAIYLPTKALVFTLMRSLTF
jgi:hypothetical protein